MKFNDILLALFVTSLWAFNFVVIKIGLGDLPPLFFAALRFTVAAIPAVFFLPRNNIPWKYLIAVGLSMGVAQFGLLFVGMNLGMPPGLSSLIIQAQVIFTFLLSVIFLKDHPKLIQWLGVVIGFSGFFLIALNISGKINPLAFFLVLLGGLFWAIANIFIKQAKTQDMLRFMIWMSLIPPIPLLILSFITETGQIDAFVNINWLSILAILFNGWGATILGFGIWGRLIHKYSPNIVVPFSLLVPIFGIFFAYLAFKEEVDLARIIGGILVMIGISIVVWQKQQFISNTQIN